MELKSIKSGSKLTIEESSKLSDKVIYRLLKDKVLGNEIKRCSFPNGAVFRAEKEHLQVSTQELVLSLSDCDLHLMNHYQETTYYTGLHNLIVFEKPIANRLYPTRLEDEAFSAKIVKVELWGIVNQEETWDKDKIVLYRKRQMIPEGITEVEQWVKMQHILRLVLENGNYIVLTSFDHNVFFADFYLAEVTAGVDFLRAHDHFYRWEQFEL